MTVLACLAGPLGGSAANADESRQATCARAWTLVDAESAGIAGDDVAAWGRVSDAFISMSDGTFDGPLSNALGTVSSAASDHVEALAAGNGNDAPRAAYDAALAALGTVCAKLTVSVHRESVPRFRTFRYATGVVSGLSSSAGAHVNSTLARAIAREARAATRANASPCMAGQRTCAYFVQTLEQRRCLAGYVCLRAASGLLASGANSGQDWVDTFAVDGRTGRTVPLSRIVTAEQQAPFIAGVNAAVTALLAAKGIGDDPYWTPHVTMEDVHAWLPQPDGIHVWFDKYAVTPGYLGAVHVIVPWPASSSVRSVAPHLRWTSSRAQ